MIITKVEALTKQKSKVYVDEEFAFVLYRGELRRYQIKEDTELSEECYREIIDTVLTKRAKLRAMNLLIEKDYTEKKLRDKLTAGLYPEKCLEDAISYVKSYHYLDDDRYARDFITYYRESRSRRKIQLDLMKRGIGKDIFDRAWQEVDDTEPNQTDEKKMIRELLQKRKYNAKTADQKEKQRNFGFLMRKGFSVDDIQSCMSDFEAETYEF
ncbi:MAG: regulatory protein RecX [Lachnospiraceae bacterium]|nr:regulatory protein RecX [Lachnospiraceae bacterium]